MGSYVFAVSSGDYDSANSWKLPDPGAQPPAGPPASTDYATIWNGGSATASGDVSTANGGALKLAFGSSLTVMGRLTYASSGKDNSGSSSDINDGSTVNALGGLTSGGGAGSDSWVYISGGASLNTGGSTAIIGDAGKGFIELVDGAVFNAPGDVILGNQSGSLGRIEVGIPFGATTTFTAGNLRMGVNGGATLDVHRGSTAHVLSQMTVGGAGSAAVIIDTGANLVADGDVLIAGQGGASIRVDGSTSSVHVAGTMTVGDQTPTATNDNGDPNGTDGVWKYTGGVGSLTVANGASVTANQLKVLAGGTINITAGGRLSTGSQGGANTLLIDGLIGHGSIVSDVSGQIPVGSGGSIPTYSLGITSTSPIEAKEGTLVIRGNFNGDTQAKIDDNATLELGGKFGAENNPEASAVDFQNHGTGTLVLHDLAHFYGSLDHLSDGQTSQGSGGALGAAATNHPLPGDAMVWANVNAPLQNQIVAATIGNLDNRLTVQIQQGTDLVHQINYPGPNHEPTSIPILNSTESIITHNFFRVTQSGSNTVLTFSPGNPIDLAVNGPTARQNQHVDGRGITVGIISDSFGTPDKITRDQQLGALPYDVEVLHEGAVSIPLVGSFGASDEGRAMAQIVHQIAPGAAIMFSSFFGASGLAGDRSQGTMAEAIRRLQDAGCQIIVDDVSSFEGEAMVGSEIENAINKAVQQGVTYISAAGNWRYAAHAHDPFAISVAAMNWLATPSAVGNYLPAELEPFSARGKVDITGPDGGPTTFALTHNGPPADHALSPFFGTSASAPVIAGVVALMRAANPQLRGDVAHLFAATHVGGASGAGLVQADGSVLNAKRATVVYHTGAGPGGAASEPDGAVGAGLLPNLTVATAALSQPQGDVAIGSTVRFILSMSDGVMVSAGDPALSLNNGGTAIYDADASDPASGQLIFAYTAAAGQHIADLAVTGVNLNGGAVQDFAGNNADFSGLFNVSTGVSVDSPLIVTSVTASQIGIAQAGQTVHLTITLNEAVTVSTAGGPPTLSLNNGTTATYNVSASSPAAGKLVFDHTVGADEPTPNVSVFLVEVPHGSSVRDASGNNAEFSGALNRGTGLQIGAAFVNAFFALETGAVHTGQTVQLVLNMSGAVTVNTAGGSPTLTFNDGATATYDATSSSPTIGTLVFDYLVAGGDHTPSLEVTQVGLNGALIQDTNGVPVDFSLALNTPLGLSVNSPLTVATVAGAPGGAVQAGQALELIVTMSKAAQIDTLDSFGSPVLVLSNGANAIYDPAASDLSAGKLAFGYSAWANNQSANLGINQVNLNGALVLDDQANNADFSAALSASKGSAAFSGMRGEYDLRTQLGPDGQLYTSIADQGAAGDHAVTLTNIGQTLQFADHAFTLNGADLNRVSNVSGSRFDDVLFQNGTTGQVYFAKMVGGAFHSWGVDTGTLGGGGDWQAIAAGDVNPGLAGGAETFVQQQSTGTIYYASLDTGVTSWGVVSTNLTSDWKLRAVGDVTGDASVDAIVQNQTHGTTYYAKMLGGVFRGWGVVSANLTGDWEAAGTGDLNGDGFADVVIQSQATGTTYWADMAGGAFHGWGVVTANVTADWQVKTVADLTGDGFADVVLQNRQTGTAYYADMKNGVFDHWGVAVPNVDASWVVEGAADVDADGHPDLLVQHTSDGTTYYAHMGENGFVGWGAVATNITADWHAV